MEQSENTNLKPKRTSLNGAKDSADNLFSSLRKFKYNPEEPRSTSINDDKSRPGSPLYTTERERMDDYSVLDNNILEVLLEINIKV